MSKQGGGFFDDDDDLDETPESYQTSNLGNEDSLSSTGFPSPRRYQTTTTDNGANGSRNGRASSLTTAGRTGGRVSSVTGAAAGSSRRDYQSTRGGSPGLDDDDMGEEGGISRERNVQRLLRAWHNEMGAPELLRFPRELVEKMVRDLARRVSSFRFDPTVECWLIWNALETENDRQESANDSGSRRRILHYSCYRRDREYESCSCTQDVHSGTDIQGALLLRIQAVVAMSTDLLMFVSQLEQCAEYYLNLPDVDEILYQNEINHAQG